VWRRAARTARKGGAITADPVLTAFCLQTSPQDKRTAEATSWRPHVESTDPPFFLARQCTFIAKNPLLNAFDARRPLLPPHRRVPYNMAMPILPRQPSVNALAHQEDPNWADEQKLQVQELQCSPVIQRLAKRTKRRTEDESLLRSLSTLVCDNQLGMCLGR
jgi:hypothetical protein